VALAGMPVIKTQRSSAAPALNAATSANASAKRPRTRKEKSVNFWFWSGDGFILPIELELRAKAKRTFSAISTEDAPSLKVKVFTVHADND